MNSKIEILCFGRVLLKLCEVKVLEDFKLESVYVFLKSGTV